MHTLLTRFGTKSALAAALDITPEGVSNAFRRGKVPSTWVAKLKQQGLSQSELAELPLTEEGRAIVSAFTVQL